MSNFNPAERHQPNPVSPQRRRPDLKLIQGEGRPSGNKWRKPAIAVALLGLLATSIFFMAQTNKNETGMLQSEFSRLPEVYDKEGMPTFLEAKARLRLWVMQALKQHNDEANNLAGNIAAYLFPDLLPDDDFEKMEAIENWIPLQEGIEIAPHSKDGKLKFAELQARIWNYENANRAKPALSPVASQVLKIYETISRN